MTLETSQFCYSKYFPKLFFLLVAMTAVYVMLGSLMDMHSQAAEDLQRTVVPDSGLLLYTGNLTTETDLKLNSSFKIPWHNGQPLDSMIRQPWFHELRKFLRNSIPDHPIVLVAGDLDFKKPLINWLITATVKQDPPIRNILLLTYSRSFCFFMNSKKYPCKCLVIPPESITAESMYRYKSLLTYDSFYQLLIVRIVVLRMVSYWGYDVANFDSDAIILKNPMPLYYSKEYADNDIIGTYGGNLPYDLRRKWGVVLCMGCIFIRSGKKTEAFWKTFEEVKEYDDQIKFNYGLEKAGIQWTSTNLNQTNPKDSLSIQWKGKTADGLKVTLLPQRMACREYGCAPEVRSSVYVWHKGMSNHRPSEQASLNDKVWFYDDDN